MFRRAILSLAVVGAACGGGTADTSTTGPGSSAVTTSTAAATTTAVPQGFTVTSEDGDVTIEVPFEAMAEDPGITIRVLAPEEYPPELASAGNNPGTVIYSMEPDGLLFDAPVRVTRRLSVENVPGLPVDAIPIVTLVTSSADGSGFELLDDLVVLVDGEDFFVSGDTTHFSPLVTLSEQVFMRVRLAQTHDSFMTEIGVDFDLTPEFYGIDGSRLDAPEMVDGVGFTRHDDEIGFLEASHALGISCKIIGEYRPRVGFQINFRVAEAAANEATLRSSPLLIPGLTDVPILAKTVAPLACVDPATSLAGVRFELETAVDHPGGEVFITGEAFGGGNSGGRIGFGRTLRLAGTWAGLIRDSNGNGEVDGSDLMYPVYQIEEMEEMFGYVAPLYSFGDYFIYVIDGNQYDWNPGDEYGTAPVFEHLPVLRSLFRGPGRFEASIGVVGVDGNPFVFTVGSAEELKTEPDAELLLFVGPLLVDF
jgi:hypothetical protein